MIPKSNLRHWVRSTLAAAALTGAIPLAGQAQTPGATGSESIIVTGSRIARPSVEGPTLVTVVNGEQLNREGFTTVYEAMKSFTQIVGATQDEQYTAGFTPNANAMDVRGLGPGRALILLDGRRITDYPLPYNGESNFVNLTAIPMAAVERIEVLSGGASAIYGSDAIAGVVNIILRKNLGNTLDVNVRYGDTSEGGGESQRLQAVGGYNRESFNLTVAAEYLTRDPIYGFQRDFMDSVLDNPVEAARINTRSILRSEYDTDNFIARPYIDPGAAGCAAFPELARSQRPGRGFYCGRPDADAMQTIRNSRDQFSLYTRADWELGGVELFASVNYFDGEGEFDPNFDYWFPELSDPIYNVDSGLYESLQRFIFPFEIGGRDVRLTRQDEKVKDFALGVRGDLLGSGWRYEATYSRSEYETETTRRLLLSDAVEQYFLGPVLGFDLDPLGWGVPAYSVNVARLYAPLTPQIYQQLSALNRDIADSSNDVASIVLTGDLFTMPAGAVSMAAVVEWGTQEYDVDLDPRTIAGDFWAFTGSGGGGERDRYAGGVEFGVPLTEQLRATLAGRYDKYDDVTNVDDAFSYNLGLEFRPVEQVLLRGSLATSFRAPDMHFVFADPSGYFTFATDEYLCRRDEPGTPLPACTYADLPIEGESAGNRALEEEEGRSYTFGIAYEPTPAVTTSLDYYNIEIDGLVIDFPIDRVLQTEADCRLGQMSIGSAQCQDALARVQRAAGTEQIELITTGPINTANYKTSGIDLGLGYRHDVGPHGFDYRLGYSHVLKYDVVNFAGDPVENYRDDPQIFNFRSKVRGSMTWDYGAFTTTVYGERLGSIPRWDETGRIDIHVLWNLSVGYEFLDGKASANVFVNNVFDEAPPRDPSYDTYPYFSAENYDPVGREWFLQLRYKFDY